MHRDYLNFVVVTKTDFVITTSIDGHLKFWKQEKGIEFVKHFRAHMSPITGVSASADGSAKVFDVVNFDMINMIKLGFTPHTCRWVHKRGQAQGLLPVSEQGTDTIRLYDGRGSDTPLLTIDKLHRFPLHIATCYLVSTLIQIGTRVGWRGRGEWAMISMHRDKYVVLWRSRS
ncbi:hypothetical protein K503DRAFT_226461 [Rhizopogon vinicolor AM-OR11-026]|uniref:WD40 repeat-like protein n=1 Tax=Rhizopogon vinicolor AM-OR11-026 TaxID=1314800 RepID=A0A1B7MY78_9AGAM|nr:hypothetical protein K503DRAFT_226461 [Rhizopogon vinicolor AM-OR11-026]